MVNLESRSDGHEKGWIGRVDELMQRGLLKAEQKDTLSKMILSPDKENYVLAQEILKCRMSEELIKGLNEGQTIAFADIVEFFSNPLEDAFVLKGYAGTGKTFLVKRIIEYITASYPSRRIAITAPTNKAVQVLQMNAPFGETGGTVFTDLFNAASRLEYMTIHKLLGLKEEITPSGQQIFKPAGKDKNDLSKFQYLIVDEVSMLDDDLCNQILDQADKVKVLFMGDPAQIPPVNRAECIPFSDDHEYNFKQAELTEIMRQQGEHPVVDASFTLRNNLEDIQPIPVLEDKLNAEGKGIKFYDSVTDRAKIRPLLDELFNSDQFKANADYAKVIAWRNKTVDYVNGIVREILFGKDAGPFVVGEKLIAAKPIFERTSGKFGPYWVIQFNTSEELEVTGVNITTRNRSESDFRLQIKVYELRVRVYQPMERRFFSTTIDVIHEDSVSEWNSLLLAAKNKAIRTKQPGDWAVYYDIMKWSANVAYNYAITAHKAQGSTYTNVLLMEEDLDHNPRVVERNRIKYTAYSRPTDKLYILRKNYGI